MKIYDQNSTGMPAAGVPGPQELQSNPLSGRHGTGAPAAGGGDKVELSESLNSLYRALSQDGASRSERVQALAAQYRNGTYRVDALATSRAMVAEALANAGA